MKFTRDMMTVTEDGIVQQEAIEITFDEYALGFMINLPSYVREARNCEPTVHDTNASAAIERYEDLCDQYSRLTLAKKADPMLLINVQGYPHRLVTGAVATLGYSQAFRHIDNDGVACLFIRCKDDAPFVREASDAPGRLVKDTPEMRAALDRVIASVDQADALLRGLMETDDPEQYLEKLLQEFTPAVDIRDVTWPAASALPSMTDEVKEKFHAWIAAGQPGGIFVLDDGNLVTWPNAKTTTIDVDRCDTDGRAVTMKVESITPTIVVGSDYADDL